MHANEHLFLDEKNMFTEEKEKIAGARSWTGRNGIILSHTEIMVKFKSKYINLIYFVYN